jgi:hypothetical protein
MSTVEIYLSILCLSFHARCWRLEIAIIKCILKLRPAPGSTNSTMNGAWDCITAAIKFILEDESQEGCETISEFVDFRAHVVFDGVTALLPYMGSDR